MSDETTPNGAPEAAEGRAPEAPVGETTQDAAHDGPDGAQEAPPAEGVESYWREQKLKADREAKNLRERLQAFEAAEEERKRQAMSQAEQLEADAKSAQEARTAAEQRAEVAERSLRDLRVRSEATSRALAAGAKQERLDAVLRLADLSGASTEEGEPDGKAIDAALKATLKQYPEFRAAAPDLGGGSNPPTEPPDAARSVADMSPEQFADYQRRVSLGQRVTLAG